MIAVALMAVAMLALQMSMVYAKNNPKFMAVSGQLIVIGNPTRELTPAGNSDNVKLVVTGNSLQWTGSFEDSISAADGRWMLHKDNHITATNIHILQAEFDGKTGTLTIKTSMGGWRIISGTGDFANCHGHGTSYPIVYPVLFGYEGIIFFDP